MHIYNPKKEKLDGTNGNKMVSSKCLTLFDLPYLNLNKNRNARLRLRLRLPHFFITIAVEKY